MKSSRVPRSPVINRPLANWPLGFEYLVLRPIPPVTQCQTQSQPSFRDRWSFEENSLVSPSSPFIPSNSNPHPLCPLLPFYHLSIPKSVLLGISSLPFKHSREKGKKKNPFNSFNIMLSNHPVQGREQLLSPFTVALRHRHISVHATYKCKMTIMLPAFDYDHHHYHYFPKCQQGNLSNSWLKNKCRSLCSYSVFEKGKN